MTTQPVFLMTDPTWFDVCYDINPWMKPAVWKANYAEQARAARASFDELARALTEVGAAIERADGVAGLPDMAFPANAAVVLDRRALLSRYRPPERRGEEAAFLAVFNGLKARGLIDEVAQLPPGLFQEGAGDCIWDATREHFWAGFGQRSARSAADAVSDFFGREAVALELNDPRFYHLDTCFCPLSGGEVLYYPPAFTPAALDAIRERVSQDQLIAASSDDASALCVNAICLGVNIVMAQAPKLLRRTLEGRGYRVREVGLAPFILSGGAAFCMTLRLDHTSAHLGAGTFAA